MWLHFYLSFWIESALLLAIPGSPIDLDNLKHLGAVLIELEFETLRVTAASLGWQETCVSFGEWVCKIFS